MIKKSIVGLLMGLALVGCGGEVTSTGESEDVVQAVEEEQVELLNVEEIDINRVVITACGIAGGSRMDRPDKEVCSSHTHTIWGNISAEDLEVISYSTTIHKRALVEGRTSYLADRPITIHVIKAPSYGCTVDGVTVPAQKRDILFGRPEFLANHRPEDITVTVTSEPVLAGFRDRAIRNATLLDADKRSGVRPIVCPTWEEEEPLFAENDAYTLVQ